MSLCRACCLLVLSCALFAQSERGTITGVIHDSSGAIVPGAKINVENQATRVTLTAVSNETGEYTVPSLSPGTYRVRVNKEGFRAFEVAGLALDASQTVRADANLEVGAANQTVEVMASAVQLQTEDAKSSTTLQNKLVNDLPLVVGGTVRTPFDLASITPDAKNLGGDNGFMLGGGQAASYGTSLDGVSTNTSRALSKSWVASNSPSVEAIEQFSVDTNGYKAEFGHAGGGNLTYVSKSGTNQYHGSAYEFIRNDAVDARNFFARTGRVPEYRQNQFGGSIGGPIIHNRTFFFGDYEGLRIVQGTTTSNVVPTLFEQQHPGNLTDIGGPIIANPDPIALKFFSLYPAPNTGSNLYVSSPNVIQNSNLFDVRVDHSFNSKNLIFGRYSYNKVVTITPGAFPAVNGVEGGGSLIVAAVGEL